MTGSSIRLQRLILGSRFELLYRLKTARQCMASSAFNIFFFFFKQKTAYEIGLGIPAEPLFRSLTHVFFCVSKNVSVSCAYTQGKREQFSGFNRTLDAINNVFRKFSAFHDETGRLNVDGMNIISNDGSNKLN